MGLWSVLYLLYWVQTSSVSRLPSHQTRAQLTNQRVHVRAAQIGRLKRSFPVSWAKRAWEIHGMKQGIQRFQRERSHCV